MLRAGETTAEEPYTCQPACTATEHTGYYELLWPVCLLAPPAILVVIHILMCMRVWSHGQKRQIPMNIPHVCASMFCDCMVAGTYVSTNQQEAASNVNVFALFFSSHISGRLYAALESVSEYIIYTQYKQASWHTQPETD